MPFPECLCSRGTHRWSCTSAEVFMRNYMISRTEVDYCQYKVQFGTRFWNIMFRRTKE
jgi:hypothetical protein